MDSRTATSARTLACSNSRFNVFLDNVREPDGFCVPDYLVVAPLRRLANGVTGVAILPIVDGGFALVHQYRHAADCLTWEIPRGFIEQNDDVAAAAARELHEETGLACAAEDMVDLGLILPDAGILDARIQLCAARGCRVERPFRKTELGLRAMHIVAADRMRAMIESSEIQDPSTIASYCRYSLRYPAVDA